MRSPRTPHFTHDRSPFAAAKRAPALALGALFVGAMFFAPAANAQTETTVAGETATTLAPTDTTVLDTATEDTAVPEGGVDAGFGGTAPDGGSSPIIPVAIGALLVGGFAATRMAKGRRAR